MANEQTESQKLMNLLKEIGFQVPEKVIQKWTEDQQRIVREFATATKIHENDKKIKVPAMPQFLRDYQL